MDLREYLFRKRITRDQFSKDSGVSVSTLGRIIRGGEDLKMSVAKKIVESTKGQVTYEELAKEIE